ncbi:MerR family transcriptional regulator [Actinopolymorpha pittospori]|uniref:DNA-binding transcriptional MerR regulator n=1 Tax=Actinopolymorpha pittospori TaxID=648752 RepID=A0A927N1S3_9ACTN|nr:MerR family transcriptional regulator [Actinopolymorpha pittospori]MBE1607347.1 DNA-binding transcriptional MerR regulator [Actinopolymorpha pittospori]
MRMAELSRVSGVSVPTIKYYQREGLLPTGELSTPNQAQYGEAHVRRLALIRSLLEVGGLSIAEVGVVLSVIDTPGRPTHHILGATVHALTPAGRGEEAGEEYKQAIDDLIARRGWRVDRSNPAHAVAAGVLARFDQLGQRQIFDAVDAYSRAAEVIAEADLAAVAATEGRDARAETALLGTVLGDVLIGALRRLAQEDVSAKQFPPPPK